MLVPLLASTLALHVPRRTPSPMCRGGTATMATPAVEAAETAAWGGDLASEVEFAVSVVQRAMRLCNALACEMAIVEADPTGGKTMDACDTTAGVSFIKPGDDTPVTAADFAIQGMIAGLLRMQFPNDRFMGEEDAADLRADPALCSLAMRLCSEFSQGSRDAIVEANLDLPRNLMDEGQRDSGLTNKEGFLSSVDSGLEPPRGKGERCWVLDPIDGTKGFMTGQGYVIGLALLDADGKPLVGVMGAPPEEECPPIMAAVDGHGLRWFNAVGKTPVDYSPPRPSWAEPDAAASDAPPWLISPQKAALEYVPFDEAGAGLTTLCCGSMIKYFACAAGRVAGFVQYEESLKTWDHACGLICVAESGGAATDALGNDVLFPGRFFSVEGGVICSSRWATPEMQQAFLAAASRR